MWEWSKKILKKNPSSKESKSLLAAYNDLIMQTHTPASSFFSNRPGLNPDSEPATTETENKTPAPAEMRKTILAKIQDFNLQNIELRECFYDPQTWQEMDNYFAEYHRNRNIFLKLLGYSYASECIAAGLDSNDIKLLKKSIAPENYNTHLKIPFDFGGDLSFDNFSLLKTHPDHGLIHRLIDIQIENGFLRDYKKIYVPYFNGKIYYD